MVSFYMFGIIYVIGVWFASSTNLNYQKKKISNNIFYFSKILCSNL